MRKPKDYRKTIVPKNDYLGTIVHAHFKNKYFFLWWIIDTGKYAEHKISQEFPCTDFGDQLLSRMCSRIRTPYRSTLTLQQPIFPFQFLGKRGQISVDIQLENGFTRNVITYHQPALAPPEINVIKSRSTDHFYQEQTGRKLPINL